MTKKQRARLVTLIGYPNCPDCYGSGSCLIHYGFDFVGVLVIVDEDGNIVSGDIKSEKGFDSFLVNFGRSMVNRIEEIINDE